MKKVLSLLILISGFAFGQEFVLTPDNYKSKSDEAKNYVVLEFPGLSQKELFDKAKMFIHSKYKYLKGDGLNEVEPSHLKLRSRTIGTKVKVFGTEMIASYLSTVTEIGFKDGKIMIKPYFEDFESDTSDAKKIYLTGGDSFMGKSIFNKKGEVWLKNHYDVANEKINQFVIDLKNAIASTEAW